MATDTGARLLVAPAPGRRARAAQRWHRLIPAMSAVGSVGLTALMSYLLDGEVRHDMLITGLVCGVVIERVIGRTTRHYRRRLATANTELEVRVSERTADLAAANQSLVAAAAVQAALQNELLVRNHLASAGMVAAGVNHEIRSPLTAITMGLEELADQLGPDATPEQRSLVADVAAAAAQIDVIVRDLSSLARPASEAVAPIALAGVIATAVRLARYQLGAGVTLERGPVTATPVVGNHSRLVQVVLNLLVNAARASRAGAQNVIAVSAEDRGAAVVLTVADTGRGMSEDTQARLFQPFFTTGADRGGTGLGLMICRSILERMGGAIAVRSTSGVGTEVEVTLARA